MELHQLLGNIHNFLSDLSDNPTILYGWWFSKLIIFKSYYRRFRSTAHRGVIKTRHKEKLVKLHRSFAIRHAVAIRNIQFYGRKSKAT